MTIFDKLIRLPGMPLARMDDVAGCRLIFRSLKDLQAFRSRFHKARFNHKLRNEPDKYDYIKKPKQTGYRGVHDVYEYNANSEVGKALVGLYIELQYRTLVQHAWATAAEVVGFITQSQPKFQRGDTRYEQALALASELLARAHEKQTGPFPTASDQAFWTSSCRSIVNSISCRHSVGLIARRVMFLTSEIQFSSSRRKVISRFAIFEMQLTRSGHYLNLKRICPIETSY